MFRSAGKILALLLALCLLTAMLPPAFAEGEGTGTAENEPAVTETVTEEPADPPAPPESPAPAETESSSSGNSTYNIYMDGQYWRQGGDPGADTEDANDWYVLFMYTALTGNWAEDLLTIASSQVGYMGSTRNFLVSESGERGFYTRYGEWYGQNYSDWCAMFVAFCMHYAEIPRAEMPVEMSCGKWVRTLSESGLYASADNYMPKPGDLVFFDYKHQGLRDGWADHVGIVLSVDKETGTVETIEGAVRNAVRILNYSSADPDILGFGILPSNPDASGQKGTDRYRNGSGIVEP